jgi:hydrogenase-4 membrane subunit HyfE
MVAQAENALPEIIQILSFLILLLAVNISMMRNVQQMIFRYKIQSLVLALVTLLTAWITRMQTSPEVHPSNTPSSFLANYWALVLIALIPVLLAILIEPLLARATVSEDLSVMQRLRRLVRQLFHPAERKAIHAQASTIWLKEYSTRRGPLLPFALDLVLIVISYLVAFSLVQEESSRANSLAVSLSLLVVGLSILVNKPDIIAQIIGLLIMEHGMFLAVVQVIETSNTTVAFAFGLLMYVMVTLTILLMLLPELHQFSRSVLVQDQKELKG